MKNRREILTREKVTEAMMSFFITTAAICILEGIIGVLFLPEEQLGYKAFFSPPLFGFFSVLCGIVTISKKEMSIRQTVIRKIIHLLLIEILVFGLNFMEGIVFSPLVNIALALGIVCIYTLVDIVLYLNDRRIATLFNEELKKFQHKNANLTTCK
ncbi:MAG TPA: hypothetical protein VJY54_01755 [Lachnospiraceae bacterium]|nr:hypothetical protein [Lachnospiraceae bacterium]